jgi:hypothetical protein
MTVRVIDLIEKLQTLDPELPVFVDGYEGGCNDISHVTEIEVVRNVNSEWYYGAHEKVRDLHEKVIREFEEKGKLPTKGVLIY